MTANSPAWVIQASSHSAQLFRQALSCLLGSAGGIVGTGDYAVTQNGTPNMSVNVAGGAPGSGGGIFVPGTTSAGVQGLYYGFNDGTVNLAIAASNPTNPRVDIAVAQVQDAAYTGAVNSFQLAVVTGTPAGSPVAPSTPASSLVLANVAVAALATTVVTANITDKRTMVAAGSMAEPAFSTYKTIMFGGARALALTAATWGIGTGTFGVQNPPDGSCVFGLDLADYLAGSRATKYRLKVRCAVNQVAPAITFTTGLYPMTLAAGASGANNTYTPGTVVSGSTVAFASPGASSNAESTSGDFAAPAAGTFGICVVVSGSQAAGSRCELLYQLQVRQV